MILSQPSHYSQYSQYSQRSRVIDNYYYPLKLTSTVEVSQFGSLPSRKFKKWKRKFLKKHECHHGDLRISLKDVLFLLYSNYAEIERENHCPNTMQEFINCFDKIIPMEYFGSFANKKKFMQIVKRILTQSISECVHMAFLCEPFECDSMPWMKMDNSLEEKKFSVLQGNILILQTVVKPFVRHFVYLMKDYGDGGYQVVSRGKAYAFMDRNLQKYIKTHKITIHSTNKQKSLLSQSSQTKVFKPGTTPAGRLTFAPKKSILELDHRPIIFSYFRNKKMYEDTRNNLKKLINTYRIGPKENLYEKWTKFVKDNAKQRFYALKLDLLDAFGMTDVDVLTMIIDNDEECLSPGQKTFLIQSIRTQLIHTRARNSVYKWNHGLLQGTMFSPLLCELYLSHLSFNNLKTFDRPNCFMYRTVDDMLFVSSSAQWLEKFENAVFKVTKCLVNENKTQVYKDVKDNPNMIFCGKRFNFKTGETSAVFSDKQGREIRPRFKFWNMRIQFGPEQCYEFVTNAMKFSGLNHFFSKFELNTKCNEVKSVVKNIFDGMCLTGFKFLYVLDSIDYLFKDQSHRNEIVIKSVEFIKSSYSCIIGNTIKACKGDNYVNIFSSHLLTFLLYKALTHVLKRKHSRYKLAIEELNSACKNMRTVQFAKFVNFKYVSKLPKLFQKISNRRQMRVDFQSDK